MVYIKYDYFFLSFNSLSFKSLVPLLSCGPSDSVFSHTKIRSMIHVQWSLGLRTKRRFSVGTRDFPTIKLLEINCAVSPQVSGDLNTVP